ncbi:MalY/PatB family protein [Treponema pedis]|uniref:MalY/PatB family protein n=1 Tax=Treponema pedis TaxID=409322 RepID=UPI000426A352|nr:MalY/PatB family protein [Treponema pedis]
MEYNFDEIIDRSSNYAAKFEEAELHYGTNNIIPLWIADMDFKTAQPIIDAIINRAEQGIFGYTYRPAEYFQSIADWQHTRNSYMPDTALMAFAPGVVPGMRLILQLFSEPSDKMLITTPVYHPFSDIVLNTGRTLVTSTLIRRVGKYEMDFDDIEKKLRTGIKFFILCNPHNPVGRVWTKLELLKLAELCLKYNTKIISDEIHSDLIFSGYTHTVFASLSKEIEKNTYTLIAPSKTFNLAGLQSATIIFPNGHEKNTYVKNLQDMDIARNNCFSLVAAIAAYKYGRPWLSEVIGYIQKNMQFINDYCAENIPVLKPNKPEATYLCWINAAGLKMKDDALQKFMVEKAGVGLSKGSEFGNGGEGFLRLNAAAPLAVIEKALSQIKNAIY